MCFESAPPFRTGRTTRLDSITTTLNPAILRRLIVLKFHGQSCVDRAFSSAGCCILSRPSVAVRAFVLAAGTTRAWSSELRVVCASRRSRLMWAANIFLHVDAMVAIHEHLEAFLATRFDNGTSPVAIGTDQRGAIHGMNMIFRASTS